VINRSGKFLPDLRGHGKKPPPSFSLEEILWSLIGVVTGVAAI
jgi:hypothetical protein